MTWLQTTKTRFPSQIMRGSRGGGGRWSGPSKLVQVGPSLTKVSGSAHAYIQSPYISLSDILSYHVVPSTEYSVGLYNRERLQTIDSFNDTVAVSAGSCKYQPELAYEILVLGRKKLSTYTTGLYTCSGLNCDLSLH